MDREFIVVEVSNNWQRADPAVQPAQSDLLSGRFGDVIAAWVDSQPEESTDAH